MLQSLGAQRVVARWAVHRIPQRVGSAAACAGTMEEDLAWLSDEEYARVAAMRSLLMDEVFSSGPASGRTTYHQRALDVTFLWSFPKLAFVSINAKTFRLHTGSHFPGFLATLPNS